MTNQDRNQQQQQQQSKGHASNNMKLVVSQLLHDLGIASIRSLYTEIAIHEYQYNTNIILSTTSNNNTTSNSNLCMNINETSNNRTWIQLLNDAIRLLPYCTDDDHNEILHYSCIILLSFLLPNASGMDFYYTRNIMIPTTKNNTTTSNIQQLQHEQTPTISFEQYMIQMPFEERLDKSVIPSLSSHSYGKYESMTITDHTVDMVFDEYISCLSMVFQKRPMHSHQVDIIHLIAMIIHPCHDSSTDNIPPKPYQSTIIRNSPSFDKAIRYMEHPIGLQFQIHHGHRRHIIQMISQSLILPVGISDYTPLYSGAILHLVSSLRHYAYHTSETQQDSYDAMMCIVHIIVQWKCRSSIGQDDKCFITYEWDNILHRMMDDHNDMNSNCTTECHQNVTTETNNISKCHYIVYSKILSTMIIRINISRRDHYIKIIHHISQSLAEAIEWQMDCWTMNSDDDITTTNIENNQETEKMNSPCLLASLLRIASHLFILDLPNDNNTNIIQSHNDVDDNPYRTLIRSSIDLLQHPDSTIVIASMKLLCNALEYTNYNFMEQFGSSIHTTFTTSTLLSLSPSHRSTIESLLAVASSSSQYFATLMFHYILGILNPSKDHDNTAENSKDNMNTIYRWLSIVAMNCPSVAVKRLNELTTIMQKTNLSVESNIVQVIQSKLYSRLTYYFLDEFDGHVTSSLQDMVQSDSICDWNRYCVGRHALVSGNAIVASDSFRSIMNRCPSLNISQYTWISTLERIASGEALLSNTMKESASRGGALKIPSASTMLHSAVSYFENLRSISDLWNHGGVFQHRFLLLRLDFLDIISILRHLTRERRLIGRGPLKNTRSFWHLRNVVRSFDALAYRYKALCLQHGMHFQHSQSNYCLDIYQSMASFMANATRSCFSDILTSKQSQGKSTPVSPMDYSVSNQTCHPMISLMQRLDKALIQPLLEADNVEPRIRAIALVELIDAILLVPCPFPRDFFAPLPYFVPNILLSANPTPIFTVFDESLSIIEASPSMGFSFYINGCVGNLLELARVPTRTIIVWFQMKYIGQILSIDDDDNDNIDANNTETKEEELLPANLQSSDIKIPDLSCISPVSSQISHNGYFFIDVECPPIQDEGMFMLLAKLGCRDIGGNEWEIPYCNPSSLSISIRVSRSRSLL